MEEKKVVLQNNLLGVSRQNLGAMECNIFFSVLLQVERGDHEKKEYHISVKDLENILGKKMNYKQVKTTCDLLSSRFYRVPKPNGGFKNVMLLSSLEYKPGEGLITVVLGSTMRTFLFDVPDNFSVLSVKHIFAFKSKYSKKLYQWLKANLYQSPKRIEINDFKALFGISPENYPRFGQIEARILKVAQKEMEVSDIYFAYNPIQTGRKITAIEFFIFSSVGGDR